MRLPRKQKKQLKKAKALRQKKELAMKSIQTLLLLSSMRTDALKLQAVMGIEPQIKELKTLEMAIGYSQAINNIWSKKPPRRSMSEVKDGLH